MPINYGGINITPNFGGINISEAYYGNILVYQRITTTVPTVTGGRYERVGDDKKGYIKILDSCTVVFNSDMKADVFLVGAGAKPDDYTAGNGGETKTFENESYKKDESVSVHIGLGGDVAESTTFGNLLAHGGLRLERKHGQPKPVNIYGSGGGENASYPEKIGHNGFSDGVNGQNRTTKAFNGDVAPFNTDIFRFAGGGGGWGANQGGKGADGGGNGGGGLGRNGKPNTGSGGGTGNTSGNDGVGGSGIAIIRWGDWSTGM